MSTIIVVHNPRSGNADSLTDIQKAFATHTVKPTYIALDSKGLRHKLGAISHKRGVSVVAAGGDGTVSAVADLVRGTHNRLGIIPTGTLNHFAKELDIPLDIAKAVELIVQGKTRRVDTGSVNGRGFVNNSSIGVYPRSLRARDEYSRLVGKWPATILGFARTALRPRRYRVALTLEGEQLQFRTPFVFVANNPYQRTPNLGKRTSLDSGQLAVYVIKAAGALSTVRILLHALFTSKHRTKDFAVYRASECTINTRTHRRLHVACDGEVLSLATPLHYKSHPKKLTVIVP